MRRRNCSRPATPSRNGGEGYFTEPAVLAGLFRVIESLYFGVRVKPDVPRLASGRALLSPGNAGWRSGRPVLPRPLRPRNQARRSLDGRGPGRRRLGAGLQKPIAYLNCNFSAPVGGKPATFTHDEVIVVPRDRPWPSPSPDPGRGMGVSGIPWGGMGRGRIALAIHGKLLLGMGSGQPCPPRELRRCAAAGAVRQDARRTQFPERAPDRATA